MEGNSWGFVRQHVMKKQIDVLNQSIASLLKLKAECQEVAKLIFQCL